MLLLKTTLSIVVVDSVSHKDREVFYDELYT